MDYSNYADLCSEKSLNAKRASTNCTRLFHCLLLKDQGDRVFETLLFDIDNGTISVFIDEVNMYHKIRLRDDPRIDEIIFFEDDMTLVAHVKGKKPEDTKDDLFKDRKKKKQPTINDISDFKKQFNDGDFVVLKIFDKVKVLVETTTEFPLDIKCTLLFSEEDLKRFDTMKNEFEIRSQNREQQEKALEQPLPLERLGEDV